MTLSPGDKLGPYEIIAAIGQGGMGEVYRARDTKLDRDVALKVLPEHFALDPDRLARFRREAQVLASLNHPHIAAIYGFEDGNETKALVLELVEGPTLADRIAHGPIPQDEALAIAMQLIEALEAAHANGIVHRDLKPANIKVRPDGAIKVLDFGIAKLRPTSDALASAPTALAPTEQGTVLGTTAYMSPEQARAEPVDQRADIWAFGVVLLEMTTARSPFAKHSTAETISAVLNDEPNLDRAPARLRRVLKACLQKEPSRRLRDIADGRLLLDDPAKTVAPPAAGKLPWALAGMAVAIAAAVSLARLGPQPPALPPDVVRFHIEPSANPVASGASAISPDGRHLAYMGVGADGAQRLWIRDLDSLTDRPLPGTEVKGAVPPMFWSPDSRFIAYDAGGRLRIVDRDGALPTTICEVQAPIIGGSWNRDGVIVFSAGQSLMRVPALGGTPTPVTSVAVAPNEVALMPVFLQDGNHFLFLRSVAGSVEHNGIFAGSLDAGPGPQESRRILTTPTSVAYVPDGPGRGTVLFLRNQDLMAQSLDETRLELVGEPRLIAKGVDSYRDTATVSASATGVLAYLDAAPLQLAWSDREGRIVQRGDDRGLYETLTLSPDGTKALVSQANSMSTNISELWLFDFVGATKEKLIGTGAHNAVWSADGTRVIFATTRGLSEMPLGRGDLPSAQLPPFDRLSQASPTSWSSDGQFLLYTLARTQTVTDIWVLPLQRPTEAKPLVNAAGAEMQAQFSPEPGPPRWVAYTGNGSGREEVFLRSFDAAGNVQLVSTEGGHSPRWRGDGRELFYVSPKGDVMAAPFSKDATRTGAPVGLFAVPRGFTSRDATFARAHAPWDVTPDGERFVFAVPVEARSRRQFTIVLNWNRPTSNGSQTY